MGIPTLLLLLRVHRTPHYISEVIENYSCLTSLRASLNHYHLKPIGRCGKRNNRRGDMQRFICIVLFSEEEFHFLSVHSCQL